MFDTEGALTLSLLDPAFDDLDSRYESERLALEESLVAEDEEDSDDEEEDV